MVGRITQKDAHVILKFHLFLEFVYKCKNYVRVMSSLPLHFRGV